MLNIALKLMLIAYFCVLCVVLYKGMNMQNEAASHFWDKYFLFTGVLSYVGFGTIGLSKIFKWDIRGIDIFIAILLIIHIVMTYVVPMIYTLLNSINKIWRNQGTYEDRREVLVIVWCLVSLYITYKLGWI